MSPFEVIMTQEKGYSLGNSGNALKTDEKIMEIPQSISVITRDMIDDLGSGNLSDVLNYSGVGNVFQGDTAVVRGTRVNMLTDGSGDGQAQGATFDSVMTDSITVARGPTAVLYGLQTSLGGMIQKNTRTPQHKQAGSVTITADEFGLLRGELDITGPIAAVGQTKFAYRVDAAHQDGKSFFKRSDNDRDVAYVAFEMRRPETTVRINGSYQVTKMIPHRNIFLTPDGLPYAGAGREEDYQAPNMRVKRVDQNIRAQALQRLFPGWDLQLRGTFNRNSYSQGVMLGNLVDWQNKEARFSARWNRLGQRIYVGDLAVIGKYTIFGLKADSFFGGVLNETTTYPNFFPGDTTFGTSNAARGVGRAVSASVLAVPMDNPSMEKIVIRQEADYYPILTTARGTRTLTQQTNAFYQQKLEVIPNRLTLTGSLSQVHQYVEGENVTVPVATTVTATSVTRQSRLLHRVGAVFNVTKDIALYAIESTTISVQTSRLIDGAITPPSDGTLQEVGVKTDLLGGRVSTTLGIFDNRQTNIAVSSGLVSPITNVAYVTLIGKQVTRGGDISTTIRALPNWQFILGYDRHNVTDQYGNGKLPNTNRGSWNFYTRYDFKIEALKQFSIGGGANRFFDRYASGGTVASPNFRLPDGSALPTNGSPGAVPIIKVKDGTMSSAFIDYRATKQLSFKLTCNNLFDQFFAVGYQHAFCIDPSLPRNFQLSAYYKF